MVHLTLAIGDFMLMLITAALWAGAGLFGGVLLCLAAIGGAFLAVRRWRRPRRAEHRAARAIERLPPETPS